MRRWLRRYVLESFGTFRLFGWWRWLPLYASPMYEWDFRLRRVFRCQGVAVGTFGRAVYVYWGPR